MPQFTIIILASGESSRFDPLKAKNSYHFLGKSVLEYHIDRLKKLNPDRIIVTSPDDLNLEGVEFVRQLNKGMAGAVLSALKTVSDDSEILIVGADDFYSDELINSFRTQKDSFSTNNTGAISAYKTESYFPGGYLTIENGLISGIVEKPGEGNEPSNLVNMVFHYYPNSGVLKNSLINTTSDRDDVYEVSLDSLIKSGLKFMPLEYSGDWKTIKFPWQVLDVMNFFLNQITESRISPDAQISEKVILKGPVIIEEGARIFEGAIINGPVYMGRNTIVANNALVRSSMIGDDCVVGFGTEVARSYFGNNVWLHKNYVGDSVFENNISLGSNAVTGNLRLDEQTISKIIKGAVVDTHRNKLGAMIGSNVRIGINVNLMPGVSIGSNSFIGPNVNVENDVEAKSFIKLVQTLDVKENKFDITTTSREEIKKGLKN